MMMEHKEWYSEIIETEVQLTQLLNNLCNYAKSSGQQPLFRGQSESDWMITSTYYREFAKKFELANISTFDDLADYMIEDETNLNLSYCQQHDSMIKKFADICSKTTELSIYHPNHPKTLDGNFYLGLAQHYGLPTNLIDFTLSPLIGLYFAFDYDDSKGNGHTSNYACLYQTHPIKFVNAINHMTLNGQYYTDATEADLIELCSEYNFSSQHVQFPAVRNSCYQHNIRIKNQQGHFYFNGDAVPYDVIMYRIKERIGADEKRIKINRKLKPFVMELLSKENVCEKLIKPNQKNDNFREVLENLALEIKAQYT